MKRWDLLMLVGLAGTLFLYITGNLGQAEAFYTGLGILFLRYGIPQVKKYLRRAFIWKVPNHFEVVRKIEKDFFVKYGMRLNWTGEIHSYPRWGPMSATPHLFSYIFITDNPSMPFVSVRYNVLAKEITDVTAIIPWKKKVLGWNFLESDTPARAEYKGPERAGAPIVVEGYPVSTTKLKEEEKEEEGEENE